MANYIYINETGVIVPNTTAVYAEVVNEFKEAFGESISVDPRTNQGKLIAAEVLARQSLINNAAAIANQLNPNQAGGIFLDAIGWLTGTERDANEKTRVLITLAGEPGTVVNSSAVVRILDFLFQPEQSTSTILDDDGVGELYFLAQESGAITIPAESLIQLVNVPLGLETAINLAAGIPGEETQSDSAFRLQRKERLAQQGSRLSKAIISGLYTVPGVDSVSFRENETSSTRVIDGVTLVQHSIYVCVSGGTDAAVAAMILDKKSGGCNYNNGLGINKTVNVFDESSGQTYPVKFDRPNIIIILVRVLLRSTTAIENPAEATRIAILDYAAGKLNLEPGLRIGAAVSSFELSGAINVVFPDIYVRKVETAKFIDGETPIFSSDEIEIEIYERALITAENITVNFS